MGQSYRIRTELGVNKTLNLQLDQDFEFLEILSLKIQQSDIYNRNCADYGVVVGRVTANNGFGIPNARVSIFIPITSVDESNPLISSIYPYKSVTDRNEDGYRYNLLPYEKSYSSHAATGTLPSRLDVLTGNTTIEIYDRYYKFTTKTNESGDYMIMGAPLGDQFIFMDLDLSDMGEFSLTPQDLIRMGLATEAQVNGNTFKTSNDLNSLPQILNISRNIEISPLWGDESLCQIAINRMDFDLRDDFNIDIQPTAVFMGSIYSTDDNFRIRRNGRIRDDFGNLCGLQAGPGQIVALRQTIFQDTGGNPIIERYELEQNGNLIDGDGTWVLEVPMNLDYYVTNEFGERVLSNNPSIGIPTKGKYRFKIKWQQSQNLTEEVRRPYYLVPNVREYGWSDIFTDPNTFVFTPDSMKSSYYFGLDWSGYTQGFTGQARINRLNEIINCEDTFYQFEYNRVYTVAGLIDEFKNGPRGAFVGIKEINDNTCAQTINKFPVNEGFRNFDLTFFVYSILLQILQLLGPFLIYTYHILGTIYNFLVEFRTTLVDVLTIVAGVYGLLAILAAFDVIGTGPAQAIQFGILAFQWGGLAIAIDLILGWARARRFPVIKLPSLTYPSCIACECEGETTFDSGQVSLFSLFTPFSKSSYYIDALRLKPPANNPIFAPSSDDSFAIAQNVATAVGTNPLLPANINSYKTTKGPVSRLSNGADVFSFSYYLPMAERINIFNTRQKYFNHAGGINRISVSFDFPGNSQKEHLDNTLTVFLTEKLSAGTMFTLITPARSKDPNFKTSQYSSQTGFPFGITGTPLNPGSSIYNVEYCDPNDPLQSAPLVQYNLSTGSTNNIYRYPADIEYYQVLTSMTVTEAATLWPSNTGPYFPTLVNSTTAYNFSYKSGNNWVPLPPPLPEYRVRDLFANFDGQYITIIQRGVDPYSPVFTNKYGVGKIFGYSSENALTITAQTRINIPIQKITDNTMSVQRFTNQNNVFYSSHFFRAGTQFSAFTTSAVGYYSAFDRDTNIPNAFPIFTPQYGVGVGSSNNNLFLVQSPPNENRSISSYQGNEDLSGAAFYFIQNVQGPANPGGASPTNIQTYYYSKVLLPQFTGSTPFQVSSPQRGIFRTDRLPSSDALDGSDWNNNPAVLQQNLAFRFYTLTDAGDNEVTLATMSSGADIIPPDIADQYASLNVLESFECENLVDLNCYSGNGVNFGIIPNCPYSGNVKNGCYVIAEEIGINNITKDINNFTEWGFRYRFFFGLCRGILAQSFTNNWVNGSLFMFPIQVNRRYNSQNLPEPPRFARQLIYFDSETNNFYFRSSPYFTGNTINPFIGRPKSGEVAPTNDRNLLFPTTIVNLGMKDEVYKEIIFDPGTNAYLMRTLAPTSYSDTSDLINMFVISRITDETFLQRIVPAGNSSLNQLFTRYSSSDFRKQRLDADITQLLSINSELGVIPFSPQFYTTTAQLNDPVVIIGNLSQPTMGVFFSSTTVDLQNKDFLTPGRLNIRTNPNTNAITYDFGIKSQVVPFYQWQLKQPTINQNQSIFGSEKNDWVTSYNTNPALSGIKFFPYQSLDRRRSTSPNYFVNQTTFPDTRQRGYIFNTNSSGAYSFQVFPGLQSTFMVGAPFHFYFGIIKGQTALDKFKTKYLPNE